MPDTPAQYLMEEEMGSDRASPAAGDARSKDAPRDNPFSAILHVVQDHVETLIEMSEGRFEPLFQGRYGEGYRTALRHVLDLVASCDAEIAARAKVAGPVRSEATITAADAAPRADASEGTPT